MDLFIKDQITRKLLLTSTNPQMSHELTHINSQDNFSDQLKECEISNLGKPSEDDQTTASTSLFHRKKGKSRRKPKPRMKKMIKVGPKKLVFNVAFTRYPLVKKIGKEMGWRLSTNEESKDFDIFWSDLSQADTKLREMRSWQKINHFPEMNQICRKNNLAKNLRIMESSFP